jgi:ATP-dependent helicase/DNAse subunit B
MEPLDPAGSSDRGRRLLALFDEESPPEAGEPDFLEFRQLQGDAAEIRVAVRRALEAVREGCPPVEIVIVARSLDRYAAPIEEILEDEGVPWTSTARFPLRRYPPVHDLLVLLRAVAENFPRRATSEILASPRLDWEAILPGSTPTSGERADTWSRRAGIIGGLEEWTRHLPEWAARADLREDAEDGERAEAERRAEIRSHEARSLGRALSALHDSLEPGRPRSWLGHAETLSRALRWLRFSSDETGQAALRSVQRIVDEMRHLGELSGADEPLSFTEALAWFEEAIDGTRPELRPEDRGGIRLLDAMRLRGLTCRRLYLVGMNDGSFPQPRPADPVLSDDLRSRLRKRTGRPLALRGEAQEEERLLLAMLLGSASERVEVSWQRADEAGKVRTPSLALRELARAALGRPDVATLTEDAEHWPSHPQHWLETLEERTGMMTPREAMLLDALRADGPDSRGLTGRYEALGRGLRMLCATESYSPGEAAYDGCVGDCCPPAERFSVTALETLGLCPMRYFFRYVLGIGELEEEASPQELAPREMGIAVHRVLERLYAGLQEKSLPDFPIGETTAPEWEARLEQVWTEVVGPLAERRRSRLPLLWERAFEEWKEALRAFVVEDRTRLAVEGWRFRALEERVEESIDIGGRNPLRLTARFDRRLEGPAGVLVGDYKSRGDLSWRSDVTQMLKGRALQVPLYWLIAGKGARVELLGVGPGYDFERANALKAGRRVEFSGLEAPAILAGFQETLRVLLGLVSRGRFPLVPDDYRCPRCPYEQACRRSHPPTVEREENDRATRAYHQLHRKSKTKRLFLQEKAP